MFAPSRHPQFRAMVAFAAICIIWGTTFAAIRVAIETIPTLLVAGVRFLFAGAVLLFLARLTKSRMPQAGVEWRDQLVAGVLMAGAGNVLVIHAEHELSSGLAALLAATIPIWMAALESMLGYSALTGMKVAGLALGFGGVGVLVAPAIGQIELSTSFLLAVACMQLSALCWNGGTLISRRHRTRTGPVAAAAVQMLAGGAAAAIVALVAGQHLAAPMFSVRSTLAVLYLAVFGSVVAYTAYNYAQTRLSAGRVASYAYVNPVIAVLTGALLLHEAVTPRMILSMVVILAGVGMIQFDRLHPRAH